MEKNFIEHPLRAVGIVVAVLLCMGLIPDKLTDSMGLRPIDILADIRRDTAKATEFADREVLAASPPKITDIPCPEGMVCVEDYSRGGNGLVNFFKALDDRYKRPVRIAFFGDSYIEGDIFCGDLRACLQKEYGGMGAGMIMPTSNIASFRRTVKHSFGGWNSYSILNGNNGANMGISGNYCVPETNAWIKYSGVKIPNLEYVRQASLIYSLPNGRAVVEYRINDEKTPTSVTLNASPKVCRFDIVADSIGEIKFDFRSDNIHVYGVSLQDETGVVVDNFSLRGAPGTTLKYLPEKILRQTDSVLHYDLIILQYGLNVMTANNVNYSSYMKGMTETVEHLKKCFSKSDIMLLSVGDRSMKKSGVYATMPGVPAMVATQRSVCSATGIVFWNLFEAMGGNGSMIEMVEAKPPKANKDYTHLNFEGGKYLGEIFFNTLLFEKNRFDKLKKNKN